MNVTGGNKAGAFMGFPASMGLLVLFFLPWVRISCDLRDASGGAGQARAGARDVAAPQFYWLEASTQPMELACASGWQLARGELAPTRASAMGPDGRPAETPGLKKRPWVYLLLAMPVLLVIASGAALAGGLAPDGAGRWMLALGAAGVLMMICVARVEYTRDLLAGEQSGPGAGRSNAPMVTDRARAALNDVLRSEPTQYLWGSLALYGFVACCGLLTLTVPSPLPRELGHLHDLAAPGRWGSPVPPTDLPTLVPHAAALREQPEEVPAFGPDLARLRPPD